MTVSEDRINQFWKKYCETPIKIKPKNVYVDCNAEQPGQGNSWLTACKRIQDGIKYAKDNDTIFVKPGIYEIKEQIVIDKNNLRIIGLGPGFCFENG